MPKYLFTGGFPRVLTGLQQGVNAHRDGTPDGATIEAQPGDEITTAAEYVHPELRLEDENAVPAEASAPVAEPAPAEPEAPEDEVVLTPEEIAHLSPEVLAQIHAAEAAALTPTDGAPAPETHQE